MRRRRGEERERGKGGGREGDRRGREVEGE
jgi:hypothetical protein